MQLFTQGNSTTNGADNRDTYISESSLNNFISPSRNSSHPQTSSYDGHQILQHPGQQQQQHHLPLEAAEAEDEGTRGPSHAVCTEYVKNEGM